MQGPFLLRFSCMHLFRRNIAGFAVTLLSSRKYIHFPDLLFGLDSSIHPIDSQMQRPFLLRFSSTHLFCRNIVFPDLLFCLDAQMQGTLLLIFSSTHLFRRNIAGFVVTLLSSRNSVLFPDPLFSLDFSIHRIDQFCFLLTSIFEAYLNHSVVLLMICDQSSNVYRYL